MSERSSRRAVLALNADPAVLQFTSDAPFASLADATAFIASYDQYRRFGMGRWTLLLRSSGEYIGWCGLRRDPEAGDVDLGFRLARRFWNQGLATEAALACVAHAFGPLGLDRLIGRAQQDNVASHRVLEKLGFSMLEQFREDGRLWRLYELRKSSS